MNRKYPLVVCATGYPLHGDAFAGYLSGFYEVVSVGHSLWHDGLKEIDQLLAANRPITVIVDDTFPHDPTLVARRVKAKQPTLGLIYVDTNPNIFKVLHYLEQGYTAYLYLGDELSDTLKLVVDKARRGERHLSKTVRGLYERYTMYRGLFNDLPEALESILRLMGEGLSVQQMVIRTGLRPEIIYRRQYRLRQHFGVESNEELLEMLHSMFGEVTQVTKEVPTI